ncbi:hypothetical protein V1477_007270 [Vespula maculifrons]|uniref:Uncharacterized protein n=1 Tax=Vespula maculifrons TaxID=7453 RepID=A0ABD2CI23_VESMC
MLTITGSIRIFGAREGQQHPVRFFYERVGKALSRIVGFGVEQPKNASGNSRYKSLPVERPKLEENISKVPSSWMEPNIRKIFP